MVHYRFYNSPQPVHIPSQINPIHTSPPRFLTIYFNIIVTNRPTFLSCLFPSDLPTMHRSFLQACHMPHPYHFSWFEQPKKYLAKSTEHYVPRNVVLSTPFLRKIEESELDSKPQQEIFPFYVVFSPSSGVHPAGSRINSNREKWLGVKLTNHICS